MQKSTSRIRAILAAPVAALVLAACAGPQGMQAGQQGAQPADASKPDPQMQAVLDQLKALGAKPLHTLTVEQARQQPTPADAVKGVLKNQGKDVAPEPVGKVVNVSFPSAGGPVPVPLRIYWPAKPATAPLPVITYYHGGGWVIADLDTYDASARALANAANAIVVSSHYRQAPEHKFPAAHNDAFAAYQWTLANAEALGGDPRKVAVVGESAGGNMAAAVAIGARDAKLPIPVHQVLIYPVTDYAFDTPSQKQYTDTAPLSTPDLRWFYEKYLATPADGANPHFSVLRAADLSNLPPTTIITAEIDPLRSEGQAYAARLKGAGTNVEYRNFEGVTHEFFGMGAVVDKAKQAVQLAAERLKSTFNQQQ
jgi:acetyl esterase